MFRYLCFFFAAAVILFSGCRSTVENNHRTAQELCRYMMQRTGGTFDGTMAVEPIHADEGLVQHEVQEGACEDRIRGQERVHLHLRVQVPRRLARFVHHGRLRGESAEGQAPRGVQQLLSRGTAAAESIYGNPRKSVRARGGSFAVFRQKQPIFLESGSFPCYIVC